MEFCTSVKEGTELNMSTRKHIHNFCQEVKVQKGVARTRTEVRSIAEEENNVTTRNYISNLHAQNTRI